MAVLTAGGTELPCPSSITSGDELIWSKNTGRSSDGTMIGDVIAEKKTIEIKWGVLTESEVHLIKSKICSGFFQVQFRDDGDNFELPFYRGSLQKEHLGYIGDGIYYYSSATAQIVQK